MLMAHMKQHVVGLRKILERLPSTGDPGLLAMGVISATAAGGLQWV